MRVLLSPEAVVGQSEAKHPYFLAVFFEFLSNLVHSYIMECPWPPFPFRVLHAMTGTRGLILT